MKVVFPALKIPAFKISRGKLLNVTLLGIGLVIPPADITFWNEIVLMKETTLFDTDDIINAILTPLLKIPETVWDLLESRLDVMAREYYEEVEKET